MEKAQEAVMVKVFAASKNQGPRIQGLESDHMPIIDLNPEDHKEEPISMRALREYQSSKVYAVTAKSFASKLGVKADDPRVTKLVGKDRNIKHPFNLGDARGRIDFKMWIKNGTPSSNGIFSLRE